LDKSGKTTSCKHALNFFKSEGFKVHYSKALKTNTFFGKLAKRFPATLTLLLEIAYINLKLKSKDGIVLQDRWFYTVMSHNSENKKDQFFWKIFKNFIAKPDMLVFFTVSNEKRIQRLKLASQTKDHLFLVENPSIIKERENRILMLFQEFYGTKLFFDTTHTTAKQTGYLLYQQVLKKYAREGICSRQGTHP